MSTLRIVHHRSNEANEHYLEVAFENGRLPRQTAAVHTEFELTDQEQEDLRWYLEEYLNYPIDPAPQIANRIEREMADVGARLFRSVLQSNDDTRDIWANVRNRLNETRIEIVTGVQEAASIPWELIRDHKTGIPLLLNSRSFVRAQPNASRRVTFPVLNNEPIRILLVICRPGGSEDVPFRSVAGKLIRSLKATNDSSLFQLRVLRPPTYAQLSRELRAARARGKPYHIIHFDGHGVFAGYDDMIGDIFPQMFADHRPGKHGYLVFENSKLPNNSELIDGIKLGALLVESDAPLLVLNACRSAHREPHKEPTDITDARENNPSRDVHADVRAFGSLAQEVMDAGAAGVVAMRYNVYVVTAAQFVSDLYVGLLNGHTLGEAVSLGRKQLHDSPLREVTYPPRTLQDWVVPIVYEAADLSLVPKSESRSTGRIPIAPTGSLGGPPETPGPLPPPPDMGFVGRDETLLALDRAFDEQTVVLLHAFAGSGKTATAAEFGRWYEVTGGTQRIVFSTFEHYLPLPGLLDTFSRAFSNILAEHHIQWLALDEKAQRETALQLLQHTEVLWIWDNVEPVTGFPSGTSSAWSEVEQQELLSFLHAARETKCKFLLTSRRDEQAWLGYLPARVTLPPMPMQDRIQLAHAVAQKHRVTFSDVGTWWSLLQYTQGNPLTITVLVNQAIRSKLTTKSQLDAFVDQLRAGEGSSFEEENQGYSRSLRASLSYGFNAAFSKKELRQLSLLYFFQGFIDLNNLYVQSLPEFGGLPALIGITHQKCIGLLQRAAEIGLATPLDNRHYLVHPALPWYLKSIFDKHYPASSSTRGATRLQATRAFVEAIAGAGEYYAGKYASGHRDVVEKLRDEEPNLLHAMQLASLHDWWKPLYKLMLALHSLYDHTGRRVELTRLVNKAIPKFVDPDTKRVLPGREDPWNFIMRTQAHFAIESRDFDVAESLAQNGVNWAREEVGKSEIQARSKAKHHRSKLAGLCSWLQLLGRAKFEKGDPDCIGLYEEDYRISIQLQDFPGAAITAMTLGHAYKDLPSVKDLKTARHWYRRAIKHRNPDDLLGRARGWYQLSLVAFERLKEAQNGKLPRRQIERLYRVSLTLVQRAAEATPRNAMNDLG